MVYLEQPAVDGTKGQNQAAANGVFLESVLKERIKGEQENRREFVTKGCTEQIIPRGTYWLILLWNAAQVLSQLSDHRGMARGKVQAPTSRSFPRHPKYSQH